MRRVLSCLLIGQHPPRLLQQTLIRYSNTEVVTFKVILYLFKMFDKLSGYAVSGDRLSGINDAVQSKKVSLTFEIFNLQFKETLSESDTAVSLTPRSFL